MKLMTIIGARPQFIKAARFSEVFREHNHEILVHTGQHYDTNMSDVFFVELRIPKPDYNLEIGSLSHGAQTGRMLEKIEDLLKAERPDGILVYGDTNSTLAGALAASKIHIPVNHVEAGLRSYNMKMPEEQNRVLTDHISSSLFCPTETAVDNLAKEGIKNGVYNTGDIMYDTVLRNIVFSKHKYDNIDWVNELGIQHNDKNQILKQQYYLATIHRAENTDDEQKLIEIMKALSSLDMPVILPLHPRTRSIISKLDISQKNIHIVQPVGYLLMLYLTSHARMVFTDSGGLQKEAYFLKTPCTTLRDQTEWIETLENGWNVLSSINATDILKSAQRPIIRKQHNQSSAFGDGHAAEKICDLIANGGSINE